MFIWLFSVLFLQISVTSLSFTEEEKSFIANHKLIRLGADPSWEPMCIQKGEKITGFDRDYLNEIEKITGLKIQIITGNWSEIVEMARKRELDGLAYSSPLAERARDFNFTKSYVKFQTGFYGLIDGAEINDISDVRRGVIAVQKGDQFSNNFLDSVNVIEKRNFSSRDKIIEAIFSRQVDYYFGAMDMNYYLANKGIQGVSLKYYVLNEGSSAVYSLRNDQPQLLSIMNKAIDKISGSKSRALMRKWSILPESKVIVDKSLINKWIIVTLTVLLMLVLWVLTLRRQIKKRKRIQHSLNRYKQNLQAQIENSSGFIYSIDASFRIIIRNRNFDDFVKLIGGRSISIGDNLLDFMDEAFRNKWKRRYEQALKGEKYSVEDITEITGELKSFVTYFNPIVEGEDVVGVSCFTEDVTQYTSLNRYLINLLENSNDYIFIKDINRKFIVASQSLAEVNGLKSWRDMIGKTDYDINPANAPEFEKEELRVLNERLYSINKEHSFIDKNGQTRWVQSSNEPITNDKDEIIGFSGVSRDITEAKKVDSFNKMLMSAIEATGDLIVFFDDRLNFLYLNRKALDVYQDEDYLGKGLEDILDTKLYEYIHDNIEVMLRKHKVWKDEYEIHIPKTGQRLTVDSAVVKVIDGSENFICYANVSRDITEKNSLKEELQLIKLGEERINASKKAEEAERQRIAADLHDGVQQKIASATIILQSLATPLVGNVIKILKEAVDEIRITSHNLSLAVLNDKGLNGVLYDDISRLNKLHDISFEYYQNINDRRFTSETEANIYRIYQESTSNILKHSKAKNVVVQIMQVENMLTLQVEDDGDGFDVDLKSSAGFGLKNMRKRAIAINGSIEIDSNAQRGTNMIVEVNTLSSNKNVK